jgi:dimethylhistidine N-methyltransferase
MSVAVFPESIEVESFAADLRSGLRTDGQRTLPSKYLYDEVGSALFEVICVLPEYGLTRADTRLLIRHAPSWVSQLPSKTCVAELGSGSSKKTRLILEALAQRQETTFFPIDISRAALAQCARELGDIPNLSVSGLHMEYLPGLHEAKARRQKKGPLLVLFLGSTIGNFARDAGERFLRSVREQLSPGDFMLLSSDLVKSEAELVLAYDDVAGVTAAFDKNVLARINRELDADFDLARFAHEARWNREARRVEMHLVARTDMTVHIRRAQLTVELATGESIKTEDSYKFETGEIRDVAQRCGFRCAEQWIDSEWAFAQSLLVAE